MIGIALFWIWPDMAHATGILHSALIVAVALAAIYAVDRYVFPVCPCCTTNPRLHHRQEQCRNHHTAPALLPLVIAICVHNLFDGWIAGATGNVVTNSTTGIVLGLLAHKIPEGVIFGMMLRSASLKLLPALGSALITAATILFGGFAHEHLFTLSNERLIPFSLAIACGSFLFVGLHTFFNQRRLAGTRPALVSLLAGILCTLLLEKGTSLFLAVP